MKLVTFTWSVTVSVPDDFKEANPKQYLDALHDAWLQVQEGNGELTDLQDEP